MMWSAASEKGYSCPLRLTFKQALELGGNVRKGETGELVVYANCITRAETDDQGEEHLREIPFLKGYIVFNAEQCDGLPDCFSAPAESPALSTVDRIEHADRFFAATGATIREGGAQAYYAIGSDIVQMPPGRHAKGTEGDLEYLRTIPINNGFLARLPLTWPDSQQEHRRKRASGRHRSH